MYVIKKLNGVQTRVLTFGDPFGSCGPEIIVVITGSPGIPEFYREFAQELYINTHLPVCVVGHAGHDLIQNEEKADPNLFELDNQIEHKLEFINKHISSNKKLHIIGHSIGAWMLLELINRNDYLIKRISSVNLLFPTLQEFSETSNGKFVNNIVRRWPALVLLLFLITQWIPTFLRTIIIKIYLVISRWPSHYVERLELYLNPIIQKNSIELACESLQRINILNRGAINKVKHLTNVLYSVQDGWVPMHHVQDLKKCAPSLVLKEVNVDHAFVLKYSELVAGVVSTLINSENVAT